MPLKAVFFDLHGTLVYSKDPVSEEEVSDYLQRQGYEASPQQLRAAHMFTSFVDYPKHGYQSWRTFLTRMLWRLQVRVDTSTLDGLVRLMKRNRYELYPDAAEAVRKAKQFGLKTAVVTTIARFKFEDALQPLQQHLDYIMTGYEAKCDKSNPRMYKTLLHILRVKPEAAVVIGDDLQLDIRLPKRLGLKAVLLDREGRGEAETAADRVAKNLMEAVQIGKNWSQSKA